MSTGPDGGSDLPPSPVSSPASYGERLHVPVSWWLLGAGLAVAVWWAFFVATPSPVAWTVGGIAAVLVGLGLARYGSVRLAVGPDGLRAGRAHLPWRYAGEATALDSAATRVVLGVHADARAHLVIRGYCAGSVRVDIVDDVDPTPYWLLSSRHPQELATRINAGRMQD